MVVIGEESGALVPDVEQSRRLYCSFRVDEAVELPVSSDGTDDHGYSWRALIGGLVVAMYLPIFKLGSVV